MDNASAWDTNWAWGLPLIVVTVIFHVVGLGLFNVRVDQFLARVKDHRRYDFIFVLVMGVTTMWATFLLAVEAGAWAVVQCAGSRSGQSLPNLCQWRDHTAHRFDR